MASPAQFTLPQKWFSTQELADLMGKSHWSIRRMVVSGQLDAVRIGRSFRIPDTAIQNLMCRITTEASERRESNVRVTPVRRPAATRSRSQTGSGKKRT